MSATFRSFRLSLPGLLPRLMVACLIVSMLAPTLPAFGAAQEATPVAGVNAPADGQRPVPVPEVAVPPVGSDAAPAGDGSAIAATEAPVVAPAGEPDAPESMVAPGPTMILEPVDALEPVSGATGEGGGDAAGTPHPAPPAGNEETQAPVEAAPASTPGAMSRTSMTLLAEPTGSVSVRNHDQALQALPGVEFRILQGGTVLDTGYTNVMGAMPPIHGLPANTPLTVHQVAPPSGCDPVPDQTVELTGDNGYRASPVFVNTCGGGEAGSIAATVHDQTGAPLPGVQIQAWYNNGSTYTFLGRTTDRSGAGTVAPVYVGFDYSVGLRNLPAGCMTPAAQPVSVTPTSLHHTLAFISRCTDSTLTGTLSINKHDENDVVLNGIQFEIWQGSTLVTTGTTNHHGQIRIENIPAGAYTLRETNTPAGCLDAGDTTVSVMAGDTTVIRIENDCSGSAGSITIRKVDQDGAPLEGVMFEVKTVSRIQGTGTTDAAGEVTIGSLVLDQEYTIDEVSGGCGLPERSTAFLDADDPHMTVTIVNDCTPPEHPELLIIKTDAMGNRLQGARFEVSSFGTVIAHGRTDINGELSITILSSGRSYTIRETIAPEGCTASPDPIAVTMLADGSDRVVTVENTCAAGAGSITVLKVDQDGRPLAGVPFTISRDGSHIRLGYTDATGTVVFGRLALDLDYTVHEQVVPAGCAGADDQTVRLTAGAPTPDLTFINECGGDVVPDDAGTPTATATPTVTATATESAETPVVTPFTTATAPATPTAQGATPGVTTGTNPTAPLTMVEALGGTVPTAVDPGDPDDPAAMLTGTGDAGDPGESTSASGITASGTTIRSLPSAGVEPAAAAQELGVVVSGVGAIVLAAAGLVVERRQ